MNVRGKHFGMWRLCHLGGERRSVRAAGSRIKIKKKIKSKIVAFTLIELIAVMTLLIVVISFSAPTLGKFFHGRSLDGEARRILSLTREAQSRAAAEGVPAVLWVDSTKRQYGLELDSTFVQRDDKAVAYSLDNDVAMELVNGELSSAVIGASGLRNMPGIRFQPDGSRDDTSADAVRLMDRDGAVIYVALSRNKMSYEIRNLLTQR